MLQLGRIHKSKKDTSWHGRLPKITVHAKDESLVTPPLELSRNRPRTTVRNYTTMRGVSGVCLHCDVSYVEYDLHRRHRIRLIMVNLGLFIRAICVALSLPHINAFRKGGNATNVVISGST